MKQSQRDLEKLQYFLKFCLDDFIKDNLIVGNEQIEVTALQKLDYNEFDKHFYTYGLLRVGRKYLPMQIKAGGSILIKARPFLLFLSWDELEKAIQIQKGERQ